MPSPFPGMDPFIEGQVWRDFHTAMLLAIRKALVQLVRPRYVVNVEEYVYLVADNDTTQKLIAPDVRIAESQQAWPTATSADVDADVMLQPVHLRTPIPEQYEQTFLEIRTRSGADVVTVLELLSPWNKANGPGRTEYLNKRHNICASRANLVEFDLLRGGPRLPTTAHLPPGDYFAFLSRRDQFPDVEVFAWSLRDRLPALPIPLAVDDADVRLDLQAAMNTAYDDAGYDYSLDYGIPVSPRLTTEETAWAEEALKQSGRT